MVAYLIVGAVFFVAGAILMFFVRQGVISESRRAVAAFHRDYSELLMDAHRVSTEAKAEAGKVREEVAAHIGAARNSLAQDIASPKQEPPAASATQEAKVQGFAGSQAPGK